MRHRVPPGSERALQAIPDRQEDNLNFFDFCVNPSPPPRLNFKEICTVGLVKHVSEGKTEGKIEVTERRGRRRKQMLDDLGRNEGY